LLTLRKYLERVDKSQTVLATEIGKARSVVNYWVNAGAHSEMTESGIKISLPNGLVVYETEKASG
jgi:hypothetical protein